MRRLRVGLYGGFGTGNTGNDATAQVAVEHLRASRPEVEVRLLTPAPDPTGIAAALGVGASTLHRPRSRWSAEGLGRRVMRPWNVGLETLRMWWVVRSVDVTVVLGGGIYEAEASAGAGGWVAMMGLYLMSVASSVGRHGLAFVGVGGTVLPSRAEQVLLTAAMRRADSRSFRDESSREALAAMGFADPHDRVSADLVFATEPVVAPETVAATPPGRPRVALGVMCFPWLRRGRGGILASDPYVDALVGTATALARAGTDVRVFGGDVADLPLVDLVVAQARARLDAETGETAETGDSGDTAETAEAGQVKEAGETGRVEALRSTSFEDHLRELAAAEVVVASRFHNEVAAFLLGRATVAVADRMKVRRLMEYAGLGQYVLEARTLTTADLLARIEGARGAAGALEEATVDAVRRARVLARRELDALDALLTGWATDGPATTPEVVSDARPVASAS